MFYRTLLIFSLLATAPLTAEVLGYAGIENPFQDPPQALKAKARAEIPEEPFDSQFLFALEGGMGMFTGGLGETSESAPLLGIRGIYYMSRRLAVEGSIGYSQHLEQLPEVANLDTMMIPITFGLRAYLASRQGSGMGLYLAGGASLAYRLQTPTPDSAVNIGEGEAVNWGGYLGVGLEIPLSGSVTVGLEARYHKIFFIDEQDTYEGLVPSESRAGDYFTPSIQLGFQL